MGAPRKAPLKQAAARDSVEQAKAYKAEADSLGEIHMAVARNKAKANLARGQKAREAQQGSKAERYNPFAALAKVFGGK